MHLLHHLFALFTDILEITTQVIFSVETSSVHQTTTSASPPTTTISASSTSPKISSSDTTTEDTKTVSTPKKPKMPRVTLKLRENETIPQMYMKAGIASYKKGNITTSVLAPRLSLEGLIFKTPEGTIKPWPQKWFFSDPSADFQWKVSAPFLDQPLVRPRGRGELRSRRFWMSCILIKCIDHANHSCKNCWVILSHVLILPPLLRSFHSSIFFDKFFFQIFRIQFYFHCCHYFYVHYSLLY